MDKLSEQYYEALCNLEYWNKAYNRIVQSEKYTTEVCEQIYVLMSTEGYKKVAKQLATGKYEFSTPVRVAIAKTASTKKRIVYTYTEFDRFVMTLLYKASCQVFSNLIPKSCYSYKQGVSTNDALQSIMSETPKYGVKVDIHAYFNSVSKEFLYACLNDLFGTSKGIKVTFDKIYRTDAILEKGRQKQEYKSLIPGSALGSFFANYCLREVDLHFEALGITYARYSDDIILFDTSAEKVEQHIAWILEYIKKLGLTINPDKYKYFGPTEPVEFLGLRFDYSTRQIDISKHNKQKIKKMFKRWCDRARKDIEIRGRDFKPIIRNVISRFNWRLYKTYIEDTTKFGWAYYTFRYITTLESLKELDKYCMDTIRAVKTGKHNKANKYAVTEDEFRQMGYVSFVEMYELFKSDFGYYCDVVARI